SSCSCSCPGAPASHPRAPRTADPSAFRHDPRERAGLRVRERDEPARHPEAPRDDCGLAVEADRRRGAPLARDLDVPPSDAAPPARAEHLHGGLLGRETRRVALETAAPAALAVSLLAVREHAIAEAGAMRRLERAPDAVHLAEVDADPGDHGAATAV